ncbi:uncharacterized protein MKK02DRAFT_40793 [Dioszegia hungarica]|uniref:Uncharacterized protein n=1 Tax=Dioszegia hungarica TaxID=4972 RepID=A0AA38LR27_9TREE|nr:uncharacterized protein MKK02DRAFT_40793 [Dioszegia hungarica]KAI9632490.1 hypothetical protein MKK02DRAFT_40793 [Dioszegia hungarica]
MSGFWQLFIQMQSSAIAGTGGTPDNVQSGGEDIGIQSISAKNTRGEQSNRSRSRWTEELQEGVWIPLIPLITSTLHSSPASLHLTQITTPKTITLPAMQLFALFTLLPLLATAAPLGVPLPVPSPKSGLVNINAVASIGTSASITINLKDTQVVPSVLPIVSSATSIVQSLVSEAPNVLANAPARVAAVVSSASSVAGAAPSKASAVVAEASKVIAAVPVKASAAVAEASKALKVVPGVLAAVAPVASTPSVPSVPVNPGAPSTTLDNLSASLVGLKAPSLITALTQLNTITSSLQQAVNEEATALKGQVDLARVVTDIVTLIRNLSAYLNALPTTLLTNSSVRSAAASIDTLLAAYIRGLQVIGLSTTAFADMAYKQGLSSTSGFSPLLVKTIAIFPKA